MILTVQLTLMTLKAAIPNLLAHSPRRHSDGDHFRFVVGLQSHIDETALRLRLALALLATPSLLQDVRMVEHFGNEYGKLLAELSAVIAERTYQASADSIALRDAVCAYVAVENSRGTPLADVVEIVKQMLRKAEKGAPAPAELAQQLVDWCHEFHPDGTGAEPQRLKLVS